MSEPLRIVLVGAAGRMGKTVARLVEEDPALTIAGALGRGDSLGGAFAGGDVVIDFSLASATEAVCAACVEQQRPLVLGSTGHTEEQKKRVSATAEKIPIVAAANFSIGVNLLFALARQAASSLGENFDVEIVEAHHRTKKDAPSGTAKELARVVETASGKEPPPVHSLRAGDIVGEHTVVFAGPGERLELTHRATSREIFARGALLAARWVVRQPPGLYEMADVLGLPTEK